MMQWHSCPGRWWSHRPWSVKEPWGCGTGGCGQVGVGWWLGLVNLVVFSNLNESMTRESADSGLRSEMEGWPIACCQRQTWFHLCFSFTCWPHRDREGCAAACEQVLECLWPSSLACNTFALEDPFNRQRAWTPGGAVLSVQVSQDRSWIFFLIGLVALSVPHPTE